MNKNRNIFLLCSLLFLCIFVICDKSGISKRGKVLTIPVKSMNYINQDREELKDTAVVPAIFYNDSPVVIEKNTNTIYIPQNIYEEGWQGALQSQYGNLAFAEDELLKDKIKAIAEGYEFTLCWYDDEGYYPYQVVFTGMPMVSLTTLEEVGIEETWNGTVEVYDAYRSATEYQKFDCMFNIRGASTRYLPKKGYKIELTNEKASLLGMRTDDDWILNAMADDMGLIHNKLSLEVWDRITEYNNVTGDPGYAAEFAEVFIDGEYMGVYLLNERVDEKELSLKPKDRLYKCRSLRVPEEHNYTNEYTDGLRPIFVLKEPKEDIIENWEPMKRWVDVFMKFKVDSYEEAARILNMENAIDYNLYCLLVGGHDNIRNNLFYTAEYQEDGSYRIVKNPWDLNATWGNCWIEGEKNTYTVYDENYYKNVIDWCTDVSTLYYMDEEKTSALLYERWVELRQEGIITEESIDEILEVQFSYLHDSGAYNRNYGKWQEADEGWQDAYIYDYVENRIRFLDQYFEGLYNNSVYGMVYNDIDYSQEFEPRYYWETNYEALSEIYDYDPVSLLEHYIQYGKPYGVQGRLADWSQIPYIYETG